MPKVPYAKPALTYLQQLQQLKNRGLLIEDESNALFLLENHSYYRLSGYWYPLLQEPKALHVFKPGSSFELAFELYSFDSDLRKLVSVELEKTEVAIRAKMIYISAHQYGSFWINQTNLFSDPEKFSTTAYKLLQEYRRSREDFILAFKNNYSDPLPPSWMILEISSFGILSGLYQNLKPNRTKRAIANYFGLDDSTFASWLHSLVYIRNICAHHSRLWNKSLSISPVLPNNPDHQWLIETTIIDTRNGKLSSVNNRTYCILSVILYFLETINPNNTFKKSFFELLTRYNNVDPAAMGFTANWKSEPIWF